LKVYNQTTLFKKISLGELSMKKTTYVLSIAALSLASQAQASLIAIGDGLIYDSATNVTWTDGSYFTTSFNSTTDDGLIGTNVTTPDGTSHTITASDFRNIPSFGPHAEVATWWGATAYAQNLNYNYNGVNVTGWTLPSISDLQSLWNQLGTYGLNTGSALAAQYPTFSTVNVSPFSYVLPKISVTDNVNGATNTAWYVDYSLSNPGQAVYASATASLNTATPNVWAVYNGNVALLGQTAVPVPGAVWLFGSVLLGFAGVKKRQSAA
jgi:hypothetical protein